MKSHVYRAALGRALLATSRHLARVGAHLVGHPSAREERVVQLRPVADVDRADVDRAEVERAALLRLRMQR